jgi:hypothetical protein
MKLAGIAQAAFWVPASFICAAVVAVVVGARLASLTKRLAAEQKMCL